MRLRAGVVSDCGLTRSANEDSFLLRPGLYAVCDGMGGARAGEVASQMACLGLLGVEPDSAGTEELEVAVAAANKAIVQRSTSEGELLGMGTTLTAALVREDTLLLVHVGDSRAYVLHEGELTQVTDDHSWVGEMVRRGDISAAEAASHPHRSVITRALGTDLDVVPDVNELRVTPGDRVLLCSDGLTGMVDDETITQIMKGDGDPQATAQALVDAALENGGEDNVTVVVVDVEAEGAKEDEEEGPSWADTRILIGPGDRQSAVSASSHRSRRSGASVRERLGRRGGAILRPGSRMTAGPGEAEPEGVTSSSSGSDGPGEASGTGDSEETEAAHPAVVPPPTGKAKRKRSEAGSARRPWWRKRWFYSLVVLLLVVAIAIGGFAWYNSTVYYVGISDGKVALYRGLPSELWGIEFSTVVEQGTVDYQSLSDYMQGRVDAHDRVSKDEGEQFLHALSIEQ